MGYFLQGRVPGPEPFSMDLGEEGDCPAMQVDGGGAFVAACVLDEGHGGPHVASDGETVVQVWDWGLRGTTTKAPPQLSGPRPFAHTYR